MSAPESHKGPIQRQVTMIAVGGGDLCEVCAGSGEVALRACGARIETYPFDPERDREAWACPRAGDVHMLETDSRPRPR